MDGGGGGVDNAKIPLLMDCISNFKLLSFVVALSDASYSSFVMLSVSSLDATCGLSTDSFEFASNIALIAVSDNCFAFLLEIVDTKDRNLCHQTCTLSERNVSIPQISAKLRLQLLYNWVSHIFSFHLEGWYCCDLVVVFLSSSLLPKIVLGDLPLHSFLGH